MTRGFLCYRTNRFLSRQYDPDRLTTPLIREGTELVPISWERALDLIAETMLRIREESGPAAILNYRSGGSLGIMKHVTDYFFERFGPVTIKSGDICSGAGDAAQVEDFGDEDSHDLHDLYSSRTIVLWGKNPYVSGVHLLPVLREAKSRGARLVLIDPVHHRTAGMCDMILQPRPGGDIALAMGVARVLFERGLADPRAAEYCDHLDDFREACLSHDLVEWAVLADVAPEEIERLAECYRDGPLALLVGWGMQRRGERFGDGSRDGRSRGDFRQPGGSRRRGFVLFQATRGVRPVVHARSGHCSSVDSRPADRTGDPRSPRS